MTYENYKKAWSEAFISAGHSFVLDEDGNPDFWVICQDIHNGPKCEKCGWTCCAHCESADRIPKCTVV